MDKKQAEIIKGRLIQLLNEMIQLNTNRVDIQFSPGDLIVLIDALDLAAVNEYQSCKRHIDELRSLLRGREETIKAVGEALGYE